MTAPVVPLLTAGQRRIVEVIRDYATIHGYPPTVRELAGLSGLSSLTCWQHINDLGRKGWIRRHPDLPRALVVLNPADGTES